MTLLSLSDQIALDRVQWKKGILVVNPIDWDTRLGLVWFSYCVNFVVNR